MILSHISKSIRGDCTVRVAVHPDSHNLVVLIGAYIKCLIGSMADSYGARRRDAAFGTGGGGNSISWYCNRDIMTG